MWGVEVDIKTLSLSFLLFLLRGLGMNAIMPSSTWRELIDRRRLLCRGGDSVAL